MDPSTSPKTYCSVLKSFHNDKNTLYSTNFSRKQICYQFKEKAELLLLLLSLLLLLLFFFLFCFLLSNVQLQIAIVKFHLSYILSLINRYQISPLLKRMQILQIMQILDSDKAHEHDTISIRMLNPLMLGGNKKVTHT